MKIYGLQKMTLLDFPGHVACTVFLNGCDMRCPFCHNFELVDGTAKPVMEEEELLSFLKKRTGLLDGVAFTGGEPCLHKDLPELMKKIRELGFAVKLDTNGLHPEMVQKLLEEKLIDYVAMDIKNSPRKYALTAGMKTVELDRIKETIALLMNSGIDYEFRTTVVHELHEAEDFKEIGELIRGAKHYYLQAFTDRDTVPYGGLHAPLPEEMQHYRQLILPYVEDAQLRGVE
ncbi:MAG: anaerobic ribonucleoside-triphosphate reductase activating protein [Erysipelotrichaceae bacterium]|nr:anaerobic ribonucleoside-triphosphate reductase activating protein [Erysipelotrichaceae bacterium]